MISLIICSRTVDIDPKLKANIEATIGYPFEFVIVDNSTNTYTIFEAYNIGVEKSKGDILCFMHDDIDFHTNNWGKNVAAHFKDPKTGAIGIAGSPYVAKAPGTWWGGKLINQQQLGLDNGTLTHISKFVSKHKPEKSEIIVLDGVWFCIRKSLFNNIRFDDVTYKGFHFYDIDIAMQVYQSGHHLFAIFDILIAHNSQGTINKDWIDNVLMFNKKWQHLLPLSCQKLSFNQVCSAELSTIREFSQIEVGNGLSAKKSYLFAIKQILSDTRLYFSYLTPKYLLEFSDKYLKLK